MATVAVFTAVSAGLALGGAVLQGKAAKKQEQERKVARRAAKVSNRRERLLQRERLRQAQADITAEAVTTGAGVSEAASGFQGAQGALISQTAEASSFQQDQESFNQRRFELSRSSARLQQTAAITKALSSTALQSKKALGL